MGRRGGAFVLAVLAILFLASVLPPFGRFLPIATVATGGDGRGPPSSEIEPLGEFTATQVVEIAYTADLRGRGGGGDDDDDGGSDGVSALGLDAAGVHPLGVDCGKAKDWTELFYRTASDAPWALYAPPWNPCGHWIGTRGPEGVVEGTIPFDSLVTGGEGPYEFATVAVRHIDAREPLPDAAKARTTVDYHAPQLFLASPVADGWTNRDLLTWDAKDAISGVADVTLQVDDRDPISLGAAPSGTKALGVTEGTHAILVAATDRAGNRVDVRVTFHFDPTAPTLNFTAPARNGFERSRDVTLNWTVQARGAPLTALRLSIDTKPPVDLPTDATSFPLENLTEGAHQVGLLAIDAAGNLATDALSFGVDATAPTVTIVGPMKPFVNSRDLRVDWVGVDAASGIEEYRLFLDGTFVRSVRGVGFEFPQISEGVHAVVIRAVDRAGNAGETILSVVVDRTAPTVAVTKPGSGETVYGIVEVAWSLDDDRSGIDPDQTYLFYDGIRARIAGAPRATVRDAPIGPHFALVQVTDRAGNPAEASVTFTYGGATPPGPFGLSAVDFTLLIVILFALALAAAYVAIRRRRRMREP